MLREHVVRQGLEVIELPSPVEELEVAEPDMRRREAQQRGAGLDLLAQNLFLAPHHAQGARRGNAQSMHGLAAEVLPDAGTQDGAAVVVAGEGREARALEMQVPLVAMAVADLAQQDRTAVAEAGDVGAELMAGIDHRQRLAAPRQGLAPQAARELPAPGPLPVAIEQGPPLPGGGH